MKHTSRNTFVMIICLCIVAVALSYLGFTKLKLYWYATWLLFWSFITFVYYGVDKGQAQRGGQRIPESALHVLALLGGFVGGWAGMFAFRHKTRKPPFVLILAISTVLHLCLYLFWLRNL